MTSSTDALNVLTTLAYDAAAQVVAEVADANTATPETTRDFYDAAGDLVKTIDPDLNVTLNAFDGAGRLTQTTEEDAQGNQVGQEAYTYDGNGDVLTTTDAAGDKTTATYDDNGDVLTEKVANAQGVTVSSGGDTYDALGDVLTGTDGDNNTTADTYNTAGEGLLETVTSALGALVSSVADAYDGAGNETTATDGVGTVTANTYDGGELTGTKTTAADGQVVGQGADGYNLDGDQTTNTDAANNVTTDVANGDGEVTSETVKNSAGAAVSSDAATYDGNGNVLTSTDGDGNVTTDAYNADGQVLTTALTDAQGNLVSSTTNTYDRDGNLLTSRDGDGNLTTNTYDGGRLIETLVVSVSGATVSDLKYTYDQAGDVLTTTDGDHNVATNTYDAAGRVLTSVFTDAQGNVVSSTTNAYDLAGNLVTTEDAVGNQTAYTYDGAGRVLTTRLYDNADVLVTSQTNTYDQAGDLLTTTDGAGDVTRNTYEGGRLATTTVGYGTASAALTSYTYDVNGDVASETDPDHNTTSYTYDALGHVLTTTTPLGTTTDMYDQAGNKVWQQDAAGRATTYGYDGGRLVVETRYNADGTVNDALYYNYDLDGNMLTARDDAGTVTMTYDGDRLITRTDPFGVTLTYGYDLAGNVVTEADSLGGLTTMTYDGNQLASMDYQDATTQLRSDFTYDGDGNVLTITRYSDAAGIRVDAQTQYAYDGGEMTSIVSQDGAGDVLQSDSYSYDAAGRMSSQTDDGVTTVYAYDATGQLTSDGATGYSYDANGNRTIAGYVTGVDNELTSDGTWNYTYDAEGNTVTKVNIATGETWTYTYNLDNRLVSAVDRSANGTLIQEATYEYDALGNRTQEAVTANGVTTVTNYAYDAAGNIWADLNGSNGNALETRRLFLQGADEVFARIGELGGSTAGVAWYLTDHEGTVQDVVSAAGVVEDHRTYDAFGNITSETNATQGDRYGFQGGQDDPVTGMVLFGAIGGREDDTLTGRWTTEDSEGLTPGPDPNEFCNNDPTNLTDPSGQDPIWLFDPWGTACLIAGNAGELLDAINPGSPAQNNPPVCRSQPTYGGNAEMHALTPEQAAQSAKAVEDQQKAADARVQDAAFWARQSITVRPDLPVTASGAAALVQARRLDAEENAREWSKMTLTYDTDSPIGELLDFCVSQAQRNYAGIPPRTVVIGLAALAGGTALYYPERPQLPEPLVVRTWDARIGTTWAKCFRNYLYSRAFGQSRIPFGTFCDASLDAPDKNLTESLRAFAEANGFASYWFCDEYQACLERQGVALIIGQVEDGTAAFIKCSDKHVKDDLVRLFVGHFHMRDVSPRR